MLHLHFLHEHEHKGAQLARGQFGRTTLVRPNQPGRANQPGSAEAGQFGRSTASRCAHAHPFLSYPIPCARVEFLRKFIFPFGKDRYKETTIPVTFIHSFPRRNSGLQKPPTDLPCQAKPPRLHQIRLGQIHPDRCQKASRARSGRRLRPQRRSQGPST